MFDTSDDTKIRRPRRIEVLTGPERRRDWPDSRKIAIVAESLAPGVNVSEIARHHDMNPQQLFGWRKKFRAEAIALIEAARPSLQLPSFAPVLIEAPGPSVVTPPAALPEAVGDSSIEIHVGGACVRIRGAADAKTLALVLKALKVLL
jgi:transposase